RVVFTDSAMPAAQPVNYLLSGEEVLFRTANGSKLSAAVRRAVLGFQTDQIGTDSATDWSVLGIGQSYEITDPTRLKQLERTLPTPWAPGQGVHTIAIPLTRLTGRILRPHPDNEIPRTGPHSKTDGAPASDTGTV
ncbi:MAG: hypothetical protein QOI10_4025, partial [Solirubrobacterales bacterium]|nr:hypothetical protein [Solirubrobacterales bacterium]